MRELLSLLALKGGVGGSTLQGECIGESCMSLGIVGISSDGCLELCGGFDKLAALEEEASAVERKVCPLTADGDAAEVGGFFAFGCCASGVALAYENSRESDVWAWLVG